MNFWDKPLSWRDRNMLEEVRPRFGVWRNNCLASDSVSRRRPDRAEKKNQHTLAHLGDNLIIIEGKE